MLNYTKLYLYMGPLVVVSVLFLVGSWGFSKGAGSTRKGEGRDRSEVKVHW